MEILGNEKNLDFLRESADGGRLSHAYIISGPEGSGKKTFADNAAYALLCGNRRSGSAFAPCGRCPSCRRALSRNHPDIIRVVHEKKNLLAVDEIRTQLVADVDIKPYYGPYKIYIIEDASLMTVQAQNALLKTIEEPPAYAVVFLLADNADILLDTIKSRSIRIDMQPLKPDAEEKLLLSKGASFEQAKKLCAFSSGSAGQALELLSDKELEDFLDYVVKIPANIKDMDAADIAETAEALSEGSGLNISDTLRKWYRDVLILKTAGSGSLYFPQERKTLLSQAEKLSCENLNEIFSDIDEADERLMFNVNARAVYEALLLRIRRYG